MHSKSSSEISPVGLLPDSAAHIARLENKLKKLKKNNTEKLTSKDLLSSLNQLKEMYMSNFICHGDPTQGLSSNDISLENVDKSYLERKLLPIQPINKEEILNLVENDWLDKSDSQENVQDTQKLC